MHDELQGSGHDHGHEHNHVNGQGHGEHTHEHDEALHGHPNAHGCPDAHGHAHHLAPDELMEQIREHEDEGACGCGDDGGHHDHDHGHDHLNHEHTHDHDAHAHSHEHTHEHHRESSEQVLIDDNDMYVSVMDHEGSLVVSYKLTMRCDLDDAKAKLSEFCSNLAADVYSQGGVVGHIKAFARSIGDGFRISITFDEPDIADVPNESVQVEGVAICLAVDKDWYTNRALAGIKALAGRE